MSARDYVWLETMGRLVTQWLSCYQTLRYWACPNRFTVNPLDPNFQTAPIIVLPPDPPLNSSVTLSFQGPYLCFRGYNLVGSRRDIVTFSGNWREHYRDVMVMCLGREKQALRRLNGLADEIKEWEEEIKEVGRRYWLRGWLQDWYAFCAAKALAGDDPITKFCRTFDLSLPETLFAHALHPFMAAFERCTQPVSLLLFGGLKVWYDHERRMVAFLRDSTPAAVLCRAHIPWIPSVHSLSNIFQAVVGGLDATRLEKACQQLLSLKEAIEGV